MNIVYDILIGSSVSIVVTATYLRIAYIKAMRYAADQQEETNRQVKLFGENMYRKGVQDTVDALAKQMEGKQGVAVKFHPKNADIIVQNVVSEKAAGSAD